MVDCNTKEKGKLEQRTKKINIYNLYITYCNEDRDIFKSILKDVMKNHNYNNITILHFAFNKTDVVENIEYLKEPLYAQLFILKNGNLIFWQTKINGLKDVVDIFKENDACSKNKNVFIYSGHSDGLFLIHKNIHIFTLKNFAQIIRETIGKKADLLIGDACLLGNIGSLNICKAVAKYMISSPGYYGDASILSVKSLYSLPNNNSVVSYGKRVIREYVTGQKKLSNLVLYDLQHPDLLSVIKILKKNKDRIGSNVCAINKQDRYYIRVECASANIEHKSRRLLKTQLANIVKYQKYKRLNKSKVSALLIILKKPK